MTTNATLPPRRSGEQPVLEAVNLKINFPVGGGLGKNQVVHALDAASVALTPGKITAVVGESGSGKTTLARLFARMYQPTSGTILLDEVPVDSKKLGRDYNRAVQMVFQDPFGSLNSMKTVRHHLQRPLLIHGHAKRGQAVEQRIHELLEKVKLTPTIDFIDKMPHQLSGGQRQRVSIARALAVEPRVLLADEPISMLDVSMRLDILNLLIELRDVDQLAILYITHDIASARYLADDIHVMYAGQIVESGSAQEVINGPRHPYTRELIGAVPDPDKLRENNLRSSHAERPAPGEPPNLITPPSGCRFTPRCPFATAACSEAFPSATEIGDRHQVACYWVANQKSSSCPDPV
ncbi:ABC transporter ATP-binding protein [Arthrobacter sp. GMC3]|uniref:ABC transporter ATP-binding protein n=1 Tax=Arthrobacter sp. GMC3 TaxID=2058894 RepID=UPI000CE43356|nr:ABC transporter ATP-binding protein [Arthrobacter sp. GMC3]